MTISEYLFLRGFLGTFKIYIFNPLSATAKSKNLQKAFFFVFYLFIPVSENIYSSHYRNMESDFSYCPIPTGDITYMKFLRYYLS